MSDIGRALWMTAGFGGLFWLALQAGTWLNLATGDTQLVWALTIPHELGPESEGRDLTFVLSTAYACWFVFRGFVALRGDR